LEGFNEGSRPRPLIAEAVADIALARGATTQFTLTLQDAPDRQGELVRSARVKDPTTDILAQIRTLVT